MLDICVRDDILGRVSVQLEMTSHDWSRLKTSGVWKQVEQILLESESKDSQEKRVAALESRVQEQQEIIDRLQLESCEQLLSQVVHNAQTGSHSPAFQAKIDSRRLFERKTE